MPGLKIKLVCIIASLLCMQAYYSAAQDTAFTQHPQVADSGNIIHLLHADVLMGIQPGKTDSNQLQKLIGNVFLRQGQTFFSCDSAFQNLTTNTIDAYGHIHINQADTIQTYSDFLHYEGNTKIATLKQNVRMVDAEMVLTTNLLTYNMDTHIGSYLNGGKLVNKTTVLTSERGYYYADTKDVYFKTNVQLTDPEYTLATDTLLYNTYTRIATFQAPTTINTGSSIIHTSCGYYSTVENYAHLCDRSMIIDSSQQLTADSMNYDKNTSIGVAYGNVIWADTARHMTVLANYAISNQLKKTVLATQKPLLILEREKDTLYTAADTLFSGVLPRSAASPPLQKNIATQYADSTNEIAAPDSAHVLSPDASQITSEKNALLIAGDTTGRTKDSTGKVALSDSAHVLSPDSVQVTNEKNIAPIASDTIAASEHSMHEIAVADSAHAVSPGSPQVTNEKNIAPIGSDIKSMPEDSSGKVLASDLRNAPLQDSSQASLERRASLATSDTTSAPNDSGELRYIIAYHHVRLFSDSLQGVSDSLYYSDVDSAFHFYTDPVLWTGSTQLTGDTIVLFTKNQQADRILLQQHAMIINEAAPGMYNQIKGNLITGYFKDDNMLDWMSVDGNAESLYYAQDDRDAFVGGNHSTSARIHLYFKDGKLNKVVLLKDIDGMFMPPTKMSAEDKQLKGFHWDGERRPKTKAELMQ